MAGDAAGWAARGKAQMRDNEKSRMGLLRMADIDEYLVGKGQIRESTLEWTRCLQRLMMCRLQCAVHPLPFCFCHTSIISQSYSPALLHKKKEEEEEERSAHCAEIC